MDVSEALDWIGVSDGAPAELVALQANGLAVIARGLEVEALGYVDAPRLALRAPWATGGLVVLRGAHTARVVGVVDGATGAWEGPIGELQPDAHSAEDHDAVSLLWRLSDPETVTPLIEFWTCMALRAWLAGPVNGDREQPLDPLILDIASGDLDRAARRIGVPPLAGREVTSTRLYAALHALGINASMPPPGTSDLTISQHAGARIPPRWVMATQLRMLRRPDLAEVVMAMSNGAN
jgi:hypothetical protein